MAASPAPARHAHSGRSGTAGRRRAHPGSSGGVRPGGRSRLSAVPRPPHRGRRSAATNPLSKQWTGFKELFRSSPVRCTAGLLLVSAVVFGLVLLNISVAQTSFHLADLQRRAFELQTEQRRLRYEVARAEAPERIVEMSTSLGLAPPPSQEYLDGPSILVGSHDPEPPPATGTSEAPSR